MGSKKKNVLIISYIFPPLGGSGVQRTLKYVKYLQNHNWNPFVITTGENKYPIVDKSLVSEIPENIEVIRIDADYTINNEVLNEVLGIYNGIIKDEKLINQYVNIVENNFRYIKQLIQIPDIFILWANQILKNIDKLPQDYHLIYSTSGPYSNHIIAYYLKKITSKPWITDFRDEWTNNPYADYNKQSIKYKLEHIMEKNIVKKSDKVITVSPEISKNYINNFKLPQDKVVTITNGYDENDFTNINTSVCNHYKKFTIFYNGLFYLEITPVTFLQAVNKLLENGQIDRDKIKMVFTSPPEEGGWSKCIEENELQKIVECTGYLEHEESLKRAAEADLLLLIIGKGKAKQGVYSGKIFEYLRLQKPILSLAPPKGVVAQLIQETDRGINVDFADIDGIGKAILDYYMKWEKSEIEELKIDEVIKKYERKTLTKKLVTEFEKEIKNFDNNSNIQLKRKKTKIKNNKIKKVLFIQLVPCIRTHKVAIALAKEGVEVDILAMSDVDLKYKGISLPYKKEYFIKDISKAVNFINESDYDILYSSNEPDYLTVIFSTTNKPIIHDCHDMMSIRGNISIEKMALEYSANVHSHGNIYINKAIKNIAAKKFNIKEKPVLCLNNYLEEGMLPKKYLTKLSTKDGEKHCVFEGGLASDPGHHRYLEPIFLKLAAAKIHVHFYTPGNSGQEYYKELADKSKYIHWEGYFRPDLLMTEITKYDFGLAVFNMTKGKKTFLDTAFPNKIWDYLAAGLPILFSDLFLFREFNKKNRIGRVIEDNISFEKMACDVSKIKIDKLILAKNNWLMNDKVDQIIDFMVEVKENYNKRVKVNKKKMNKSNSPSSNIKVKEDPILKKIKGYFDQRNYDKVIRFGEEYLKNNYNNAAVHYFLGISYNSKSLFENAFSHHQKALELNKNMADIKNNKYQYKSSYEEEEINCLACSESESEAVWIGNQSILYSNKGLLNPLRKWVKCRNCGLVYANPSPSEKSYRLFYKKIVSDSTVRLSDKSFEKKVKNANLRLSRINYYKPYFNNLLDIGAGRGIFVGTSKDRGRKAIGLELTEEYCNYAAEYLNIKLKNINLFDYNPPFSFDVITFFAVIEHLRNPIKALEIINSFLKKNGLLVVSTPDLDSLYSNYSGEFNRFWYVAAHLSFFSREVLIYYLQKMGFKILDKNLSPLGEGRMELYCKKVRDI